MSDPKQPIFVPVVAGDLTDASVYVAPGDPWDGVASLQIPSAGTYSAGLAPDQSWFGAQTMNGILQNYGQHIEAIADHPTFDTRHPLADIPGSVADYCLTSGDTHPNVNDPSNFPLIYATDKFLLAQLGHKNGSVGAGFVRRWRQSSHTENSFEADQAARNPTTTPGPFTDGTSAGDTAAGDPQNNPAVLGVDTVAGAIISLGSGRSVTLSNDYGVTWSVATALPTDTNWHYPLAACAVGSQWVVIDQIDTATTVNRLVVSADLTAASWTVKGSSIGGSNSNYIRRIITNGTIAVFLPQSNTNFGYWRTGDANVTPFRLGGIANDGTRTGWRGAWNSQIGRFLIGNAQGDLWLSSDGINWAQIATNMAGLSVRDIVGYGRGFVISNSGVTWAIDYLDFDRKFAIRLRHLYQATNQAVGSGFHLARLGGRWYGARVTNVVVGGPTNSYRLEWVFSGVNAWDKNNAVGR